MRTTSEGPVSTGSLLCEDKSASFSNGVGPRTQHFADVACCKLHDCSCFLSIWPHRRLRRREQESITYCEPSCTTLTLSSISLTLPLTPLTSSSILVTLPSILVTLPSILVALWSTPWVSVRSCAVAIRTSSCVNLSNRLRASSISVFPISFFRCFSGEPSAEDTKYVGDGKLTCSSPFNLLGSDSENI